MKHVFRTIIFSGLILCFTCICAQANGLVITNGGVLEIKSGTLDIKCQPLTLKNGGTLILGDGAINHVGRLTVESGGSIEKTGGVLRYCFYTNPAIFQLLLLDE
jgi:hypothetical protein